MNRNSALALSVVERIYDQIDQGQDYYDGIVNFLNSKENHLMKLSSLEEELEKWVQHRLLKILEGKAGLMAGGMRRSATIKKLTDKQRKPVDTCATYLKNKARYLKYDSYLDLGFPIATGVIEGACRHLVKDRMDITGAKWRLTSAEAVLRLRALRSSNDFDEYWNFHEDCEYKRNHQSLYQDGEVPPTRLPKFLHKGGQLRVVK